MPVALFIRYGVFWRQKTSSIIRLEKVKIDILTFIFGMKKLILVPVAQLRHSALVY